MNILVYVSSGSYIGGRCDKPDWVCLKNQPDKNKFLLSNLSFLTNLTRLFASSANITIALLLITASPRLDFPTLNYSTFPPLLCKYFFFFAISILNFFLIFETNQFSFSIPFRKIIRSESNKINMEWKKSAKEIGKNL